MQSTHQTEFRFEKIIKKKGHKLYIRWKNYDNFSLTARLIEKIWLNKMSYYPELELDFSSNAIKPNVKNRHV